jgi:selenocysteine lyase/cysteine desulfurase
VAKILRAPVDTVVFVSNATIGVNTVLKNLVWNEDGRDEILYFNSIYAACGKIIDYILDSNNGRVSSRCIGLAYPMEDEEVVALFRAAVQKSKDEGKRPLICVFDTVSSMPGVRFPFEAMTKTCKELGVMSLVDGAQGIGLIDIDLTQLDPDFFVSNCHKWLHVPRACAVFYVPFRNQDLIRTSLATSHGYVSRTGTARASPFPTRGKTRFVNEFEFVGTLDNSPYLAAKDAIKWREEIGGEAKILEYQQTLAKEGGRRVAEILGTEVIDNKTGTLTNCAMVNVFLPLVIVDEVPSDKANDSGDRGKKGNVRVPHKSAYPLTQWMLDTMMSDYQTFIALGVHRNRWFARLSAQVYLDMEDFEWAGNTLRELCDRAAKHELVAGSGL